MPRRTVEHAVCTERVSVEVRTACLDELAEVATRFEDRFYVSFALGPRQPNARGRYAEIWPPPRSELVGDVLFVPPGMTMMGSCSPGDSMTFACQLDRSFFGDQLKLGEAALVESLHLTCPEVRRDLRRMLQEAMRPGFDSPLCLEASATLLAADIGRRLNGMQQASKCKRGGLSPSRMRRIEECIRSDETLPTLAKLAAHCGLSPRHLARVFRQETGRAIGEYVSEVGREKACALLRETDLPLREIARRVGFSGAASFCYAFRRATGLRPSDLRCKAPRERGRAN